MIPIAFLTPHEQRNQAGPIAITKTGAVREVPFDGGEGWFVEEGTTNLFTNPAMNPAGVSLATAGNRYATFENVPAIESLGGITTAVASRTTVEWPTGVNNAGRYQSLTLSGPVPHTISVSVYIPVDWSGGDIRFVRGGWSGQGDGNVSLNMSIRGEWQRVSMTFSPIESSLVGEVGFAINNGPWLQDEFFLVTGVQIEAKPYATSFAHGDMGTGYSWTGTPHQSASVRQRSRVWALTGADIPRETGSMYSRLVVNPNRGGLSTYLQSVGTIGGANVHQMNTYIHTNGTFRGRAGWSNRVIGGPAPLGVPINVYMEWNRQDVAFDYRDGAGKRYDTANYDWDTSWAGNGIALGDSGISTDGSSFPINGPVLVGILFDHPLTDTEIARLDAIPTSELTWANVARPEMRVKVDGEIVRATGYKAKYSGLLKDVKIGRIEYIARPTLLLSPALSADRNGPVVPNVSSGVQIVDGQYGPAWYGSQNGQNVTLPNNYINNTDPFTIITRMRIDEGEEAAGNRYSLGVNGTNGVLLGRAGTNPTFFIGGTSSPGSGLGPNLLTEWSALAVSYDGVTARRYVDGTRGIDGSPPPPNTNSAHTMTSLANHLVATESTLIYDRVLPDSEIARISNLPAAWTMENTAAYLG